MLYHRVLNVTAKKRRAEVQRGSLVRVDLASRGRTGALQSLFLSLLLR